MSQPNNARQQTSHSPAEPWRWSSSFPKGAFRDRLQWVDLSMSQLAGRRLYCIGLTGPSAAKVSHNHVVVPPLVARDTRCINGPIGPYIQ